MPDDRHPEEPLDSRSGRPDLVAALRELAQEYQRGLGEHPDAVTLLDYHEGRLPETEADRVQEHLARCPECARAVLDFAAFLNFEPPSEEHGLIPPDFQSRWRELQARLEAESRAVWRRQQILLPLAAGLFLAAVGLGGSVETLQQIRGPENRAVTPLASEGSKYQEWCSWSSTSSR